MKLLLFAILLIVVIWSLRAFLRAKPERIANKVRTLIIFLPIIIGGILILLGKFLFSLPFFAVIIPLIKGKAGLSLWQFVRIWSLLRILKQQGRFQFGQRGGISSQSSMTVSEAYEILNLDPQKKYSKDFIQKRVHSILKRVHPDISPDCAKLASIVNTARDTILKNL